MAQYLHLGDLDINDRTTYWLDRLYFPPPKPKMEWLDPAHRDGQDLQAFKYDNREITFQVSVKAATEEALSTAIHNLWLELGKKNNVLEWCPQGWTDHLYFDTYLPDNIDPSEFFREFTRQQEGRHWLAMMEVKLQALPFARGDEETLVVFEQLAPNGDMENWTAGVPDGWTENTGASSSIDEETTEFWHGAKSAKMTAGTDVDGGLLPDEDCSFEGGTVGGWGLLWNCTIANDAANGYHCTHSLEQTVTANGAGHSGLDVTAVTAAATEYTFAVKLKSATGRQYRLRFYDDVAGYQEMAASIVADGTWQTATLTKTFGAGSTVRRIYLHPFAGALAGDIVYWDACILKAGASAIPPKYPECYMTTTDYIPVDENLYHHFDAFALADSGTPSAMLEVLCYDSSSVLLDTLEIANAATGTTWYQHAHKTHADMGVIAPSDFPADTVKVKLRIWAVTCSSIIYVDQIYFGCSQYAPQHRVESPVSIVVPGADFKGDGPSPADVYLDEVFWESRDIFLGQRDRYHEDFDGVAEPTGDTTVDDNRCLTQDHEEYTVGANVLNNPGFELPGGFSKDNTDAFTNWTITRDLAAAPCYIGANTTSRSGSWAAIFMSLDGDAVAGNILSDAYAVNVALDYYVEFWLFVNAIPLVCDVEFYNGAAYLDKMELFSGYGSYVDYSEHGGVIASGDFPAATTHVRLKFLVDYNGSGVQDFVLIDDVRLVQQSPMGEVNFPLEAHEGRYLPTSNVSVSAATPGSSELTLSGIMVSDTLGEIGALIKESVADLGDPNTNWISILNRATRWDVVGVPSMRVSDNADKTALSQRFRMLLGTAFDPTRDFWVDFFALLPIDQAVLQAVGLTAIDHLIIDCRSDFRALVRSLDGTLDNASMVEGSKWIGDLGFRADPAGVNMVILAFWADGIYREPRPVLDVKLKYTPLYALVGDV